MSPQKRPLAFLLGISANLGFAAGNVALGLHRYMPDDDYDVLIYHSSLADQDREALQRIPRVTLVPFGLDQPVFDLLLARLPEASRFRNRDGLMCLCHFEAFALLSRYHTVVWLDADVAIQGSLKGVSGFRPFGITSDTPWTVQHNFIRPIAGYDMDVPGWCTAVMAVHDALPYDALHTWCYDKAAEHAASLFNPDQGIINIALQEFGIRPNEMPFEEWQCVPWREQAATARIVHFGTERKVWSDANVFNAFPEWYRVHRDWLRLGGRDFDRAKVTARSPVSAFDDLDIRSGRGSMHWHAPGSGPGGAPEPAGTAPGPRGALLEGAKRLYSRARLYDAPPGSLRRAGHEFLKALGTKAGLAAPPPPVPPPDRPDIAFRLRGGLGDHLIAARYIRDLSAAAGGLAFDLYSSRPESAAWVFAGVPGVNTIYNEHLLWDRNLSTYSLPVHLQQYVYLYLDQADCRKALESNRALTRICETIQRHRYLIEEHIVGQPYSDHVMAEQAVLRGWNRYTIAHRMSGLPYGGHQLALETSPDILARHGLLDAPYITLHNSSDENFLIDGRPMGDRRSTKLYPHFDSVVRMIHERFAPARIVHLGTASSRAIPGVDLDLRGRCSIAQTAAVLAGARIHLDVEGGLVHLAACLGTRSCVLFGPTSLDYFAYEGNINIPPATCGNCWWLTRDWMMHCAKGCEVQKCLDDLDPATVLKALAGTLGGAPGLPDVGRLQAVHMVPAH